MLLKVEVTPQIVLTKQMLQSSVQLGRLRTKAPNLGSISQSQGIWDYSHHYHFRMASSLPVADIKTDKRADFGVKMFYCEINVFFFEQNKCVYN